MSVGWSGGVAKKSGICSSSSSGGRGKGLVLRLFPSSRYPLDDMGQQCAEGQG